MHQLSDEKDVNGNYVNRIPLKEVLLDIQYNTGNLNQRTWPNLYRAIRNHDVNGIVSNVHRRDVAQRHNNWTRDTARSIRF